MVSPYPPSRDGIGDYTAALVGALAGEGHAVGVVAPRAAAGAPAEVLAALGGSAAERAVLRRRVAAFAPDVVHVQFAVAAFGTRAPALWGFLCGLRAETGVPVVVTAHEVTRDTAILRGAGRLLYRLVCARADRLLVHTDVAARALGRIGADTGRVAVLPLHRRPPPTPATDARALRAAHGLGDDRVLLAFGFVHVDKGLDDLVAALALLRDRGDPSLASARLVVAGTVRRRSGAFRVFEARDRLYLARVRRLVAREGLGGLVTFTGYVPEGAVAAWFDLAEGLVLPYRRIEQSSVASLAAALGAPVVASRAGRLAEDFGDPRWTFAPGDRDGLATALSSFLGRREDGDRRDRGPRSADGADLDAVAHALVASYAAVLTPRARQERPVEHA